MNDIRPFRGVRYDEGVVGPLGSVLCPPYDVISPNELRALQNSSPFNMVRLELPTDRPEDDSFNTRYRRAAKTMARWMAEGELREDREPAFYLYEQQFEHQGATRTRRGLLASLRLAEWEEGVVLPHEETMAKPKEDRLNLMRATSANLSPLFLLFDDPSGGASQLMARVAEAEPDFTAETPNGQIHRVWLVAGPVQARLAAALEQPQLFMADGHHRYETALSYRAERRAADPQGSPDAAYNYALVLLVDARDPGMVVLPTHRLVRGIERSALARLDDTLPGQFNLEKVDCGCDDPKCMSEALVARLAEIGRDRPALGIYRKGNAMVVSPRPEALEQAGVPVAGGRPLLDVDLLHDMILSPLLDIGDEELRAGSHVVYTRDGAEALGAVNRGDAQAAFLLNPTQVEQVLETARAAGRMPQKSTYFYPKPVTGLVVRRLG